MVRHQSRLSCPPAQVMTPLPLPKPGEASSHMALAPRPTPTPLPVPGCQGARVPGQARPYPVGCCNVEHAYLGPTNVDVGVRGLARTALASVREASPRLSHPGFPSSPKSDGSFLIPSPMQCVHVFPPRSTHAHARQRGGRLRVAWSLMPSHHPTMMTCMQFAQPLDFVSRGVWRDITTSSPPLTTPRASLESPWHLSDLGYNVTAGDVMPWVLRVPVAVLGWPSGPVTMCIHSPETIISEKGVDVGV